MPLVVVVDEEERAVVGVVENGYASATAVETGLKS